MPAWGYVELAVKKGGPDAILNLWTPKAWGLSAKEAKKKVGVTTGVGFSTDNFEATVASLRRRASKSRHGPMRRLRHGHGVRPGRQRHFSSPGRRRRARSAPGPQGARTS